MSSEEVFKVPGFKAPLAPGPPAPSVSGPPVAAPGKPAEQTSTNPLHADVSTQDSKKSSIQSPAGTYPKLFCLSQG